MASRLLLLVESSDARTSRGAVLLKDMLSRIISAVALYVLVAGVVLLGLVGSAAAAAAPNTIAVLHGATAVESYGDVAAWSDYDSTERSWHVVVRRDGQISTPPIPSASKGRNDS
jgi:TRAP-type mannitol/chloroaromatic compound transport system permease large subunit